MLVLTFVLTTLLGLLTQPEMVTQGVSAFRTLVHLVGALILGVLAFWVRRRSFSERGLAILDFTSVA